MIVYTIHHPALMTPVTVPLIFDLPTRLRYFTGTSATLSDLYRTPIEVLTTSDGRLVVVGQPEAPAHHHDRHGS